MPNVPFHPVNFSVDYPERELDWLTTLFRPSVALPILLLLGTVAGHPSAWGDQDGAQVAAGTGGVLILGPLLMLLFRRKYP